MAEADDGLRRSRHELLAASDSVKSDRAPGVSVVRADNLELSPQSWRSFRTRDWRGGEYLMKAVGKIDTPLAGLSSGQARGQAPGHEHARPAQQADYDFTSGPNVARCTISMRVPQGSVM